MTLKIGALIKSSDLFKEAFTHKSLSQDKNFERLEFLGDSILGAKITELLYAMYSDVDEGSLSRWKSALVSQETLAEICNELDLCSHLLCGVSVRSSLIKNPRIKASLFESFLGAYYLTNGNREALKLIKNLFGDRIKNANRVFASQDTKTIFQEKAQKRFKLTPTYNLINQTGPSHAPEFQVEAVLGGEKYETGRGSSLKEAQMEAARSSIIKMENT